ncbi:hypothetical protein ACLOJK_011592 [Asimina triloba]
MSSRMTFLWLALLGLWSFLHLLLLVIRRKKKKPTDIGVSDHGLPPGPKGLPILGSLRTLGHHPHRTLQKLATEYGPIMHMRLGLVPTIVVSSPGAAEQFLKAHDLAFASRPLNEAGRFISFGRKGMAFSQYGPYWRNMRKLCTIELLSNLKIESFRWMRRDELGLLVRSIKDAAVVRQPVNLTIRVSALVTDMVCRMRSFKETLEEIMYLAGAFNIADYIPCLSPLDIQGLRRRMKETNKFFDSFFEKIIDEHLRNKDASCRRRDFVDFLLEFMASSKNDFGFDRSSIKAIMLEMFVAAVDTSSVTIDWAMSELLKHPRIMKKAQEELETVIGLDRAVEESDLANLDYLNMVVKETLRLHPIVPLLLPHEAMEDCTVSGFHIPKQSRIIVNAWAIGRDPDAWTEPNKFDPERFAGSSVDVRGHDFQLIPFGSGRRMCPGLQLGITVVRFVLAQLLHCFDWELPEGTTPENMNMSEKFSIVTLRSDHLLAIPTYRLRKEVFG